MNELTDPWREELGAYLLGALDADEAERMRLHLEQCPECRAAYAELAPTVDLLAKVPAEAFAAEQSSEEPLDPAVWERLRARAGLPGAAQSPSDVRFAQAPSGPRPNTLGRPPRSNASTRPSRRPRRQMRPATAALLSGVLVAGAAFGIYQGTRPSPAPVVALGPAETVSATNAADGVSGTVQYWPTGWGSGVQITLRGVKPGDNCVLYAEDGHGNKSVASSWWAPEVYGQSATIPGGVNMASSNIKNFQVTTTVGEVLLDIPAS
jgi:predicted anti-sigma-YlaC factor YlaD